MSHRTEKQGFRVEVITANHQNKSDIGVSIAREWFEVKHVDAIADVMTFSVALAVSQIE